MPTFSELMPSNLDEKSSHETVQSESSFNYRGGNTEIGVNEVIQVSDTLVIMPDESAKAK